MSKRRLLLVDTARRLFYQRGFRQTGVDVILSEAGVAKMTLYNHFGSKDTLILEALAAEDQAIFEHYRARVGRVSGGPEAQLGAIIDATEERISMDGFNGCMFAAAVAEYPETEPVRAAAATHKQRLVEFIAGLAAEAGVGQAMALAEALVIIVEGTVTAAHVGRSQSAARRGRAAYDCLVDVALA